MSNKKEKDKRKEISTITKQFLWGAAAGRCEFKGCNKKLYEHEVTKDRGNYAENAHIHAVSPKGARYAESLSADEKNDIDNLMLLCQSCHKTIDGDESKYPAELLYDMKINHENRVRVLTEFDDIQNSLGISYFANIGGNVPKFKSKELNHAIVNNRCIPRDSEVQDISSNQRIHNDGTPEYYDLEIQSLERELVRIQPLIDSSEHISVFALAPQPLLIKLGEKLSDITNMSIFQCHRVDNYKWTWPESNESIEYYLRKHNNYDSEVVSIILSLSAKINVKRITDVLGLETSIYEIEISNPNRNFLSNKLMQDIFIKKYRDLMEKIKRENPNCKEIALFPSVPNSIAVRIGMDYMSKTDFKINIYDEKRDNGGFIKTITIGGR